MQHTTFYTSWEKKKCECHKQDLSDWLRTSVTASCNAWLTFPVEEKQESKKGQGWGGGACQDKSHEEAEFLIFVDWKKKLRLWFCLLYMGFLDIKQLENARSYQRFVFFLVLHDKDCAACSKLTNAATSPCFTDGIRPTCLWTHLSEKWDLSKTWYLCLKVRTYFTTHFNLIYYMSDFTCSRIWKYYSVGMGKGYSNGI